MIEFYNFEIIDMQCTRILDLINDIREQYIECEGYTLPEATTKQIENATIDMASAVLKLRRAEGTFKRYKI